MAVQCGWGNTHLLMHGSIQELFHILASLDLVRNVDLVLVRSCAQGELASRDPFLAIIGLLELRVHG